MSDSASTHSPSGPQPAISSLFGDTRWSDLEIRCGKKTWRVHRNIVCSQSKFFEKAAEGPFRESSNGVVVLEEDDPSAIEVLLKFFYTGTYQKPTAAGDKAWSPFALAVLVHTVADKYGVKRLVELADVEFALQAKEMGHSQALVEAVEAIYDISPEHKNKMRDIVIQIVATDYKRFKTGTMFEGCQAVFDIAPFVTDLLELRVSQGIFPKGFTRYACPSFICQQQVVMRTMPNRDKEAVQRNCPYCGTKWENDPCGWVPVRSET